MRKKIVAGNWKMNMNLQDGIALAKELNETLKAQYHKAFLLRKLQDGHERKPDAGAYLS